MHLLVALIKIFQILKISFLWASHILRGNQNVTLDKCTTILFLKLLELFFTPEHTPSKTETKKCAKRAFFVTPCRLMIASFVVFFLTNSYYLLSTVRKILVHLSNVTFGFPLRMWDAHKNDILKIWNIFIKATNKCKQLFKYYILQIRVNTK